MAAAAPPPTFDLTDIGAGDLRRRLLAAGSPYVRLDNLVALSWGVGIPVAHLRVFPWPQKRMAAMTIRVRDQSFILLAKDATYPPWIAFYLAHELAHIALAHVDVDEALVDLESEGQVTGGEDDEERAADAWALELLTGRPDPNIVSADGTASARELARVALSSADELGIEPGTLALCFGYTTGQWAVANGSLKIIYAEPSPVWQAINRYASTQLRLDESSPDAADFLETVLELGSVS
jgi:hypothetical protein